MKDFGLRLRLLRERRGLDQVDLAGKVDLAGEKVDENARRNFGRYVSKIETGHETNPSLEILQRLQRGFGFITLSEFITQLERQTEQDLFPTPDDPKLSLENQNKGGEHGATRSVPASAEKLSDTYRDIADKFLTIADHIDATAHVDQQPPVSRPRASGGTAKTKRAR